MPTWRSALAVTSLIALCLVGCTSMPQPATALPPHVEGIKYLGEIKGRVGARALLAPKAVAVDQNGNLYIADTGNNRVIKLDRNFAVLAETGGFGSQIGGLNRPVDIVSDGGVYFYVLDQGNRRVVKLDYNLLFVDEIRFDENPDLTNVGLVAQIDYTSYGRMVLLDPDNLRGLMLDPDHALERTLLAPGGFAACAAVNSTADGSIYIYDSEENVIYGFDAFGSASGKIIISQQGRLGDFIVGNGYIMATGQRRNQILFFSLDGSRLPTKGGEEAGSTSPSGMVVSPDGRLFVCDTGNNRITYYEIIPD